jgi:hypothetical protein
MKEDKASTKKSRAIVAVDRQITTLVQETELSGFLPKAAAPIFAGILTRQHGQVCSNRKSAGRAGS